MKLFTQKSPSLAASMLPTPRQQHGIGVLGFIFGLVAGLAVALIVAVYISKVPTPFVDKSGVRTAEQQLADEAKLKDWNPNAALVDRAASAIPVPLPAQTTSAAAPPNSAVVASAAVANPTPPVPAAVPERPENKSSDALKAQEAARLKAQAEEERKKASAANASNDPIGSLLQARNKPAASAVPSASATKSEAAAEPFIYFVQAGAFREQSEADAQKARLSLLGISAQVTERDQAGRPVHRVRVGPFNSKAEADRARAQLENAGLDTALVRIQR